MIKEVIIYLLIFSICKLFGVGISYYYDFKTRFTKYTIFYLQRLKKRWVYNLINYIIKLF